MKNNMQQLLEEVQNITTDLQTEKISKTDASTRLEQVIEKYNAIKDADVENWTNRFVEFLGIPEAQKHLKELFNSYLSTNDADDKQDRNQKLYIHQQLQELLILLDK